jgi:hypothetical protein
MKRFRYIFLILLIPFLTQCEEDREQRMLFEAAQRTEADNPSAHFTETAYELVVRFKPETKLAKEAEDKIEIIKRKRERR